MAYITMLFVAFIAIIIGSYLTLHNKIERPKINKNAWWGAENPKQEKTSIRPFKIRVSAEEIRDLKQRLNNHRPFTPPLEDIQQQYGMNTKLLDKIVKYWSREYNWTEREIYLNQYPQFKTNIQGLDIHFLHVKPKNVPKGVNILPLLILHGWGGSVVEFYEAIPLLTTPKREFNFVFEVIIPSLPGFGFSQGAAKPGLSVRAMGVIFNELMQRLGFDKYYVQGGDWGSMIALYISTDFIENVKGIHSNMCLSNYGRTRLKIILGALYPSLIVKKEWQYKMYPLSEYFKRYLRETGYLHIQATKPDTLGVALGDSPVGLAAYLLEKFTIVTNMEYINREDGGLWKKFTIDQLLDNVMYYYITNSITTSMRIYAESMNSKFSVFKDRFPITVPSACLFFKNEIYYQPEHLLRDRYHNLVHYKEHEDGGHFAAFELPEIFSQDVWEAINAIENITKKI